MIGFVRPPGSNYYFLNGPEEEIKKVDIITSYLKQGYEWSDKYKSGEWDGKSHMMFKSKHGLYMLPCGLLERVLLFLRCSNVKYTIDNQVAITPECNTVHGIALRDYQEHSINSLQQLTSWSGVVSLPTGAGKTILALWWAVHLGLPFMVMVHRKELMDQWKREIEENLGFTPTLIGGGAKEGSDFSFSSMNVAMMQSIAAWVPTKHKKIEFDGLLIVDECHICPADTFFRAAMRVVTPYRLGLSATPTRADGEEMRIEAALGPTITAPDVSDLIADGNISQPTIVLKQVVPPAIPPYASWQQTYSMGIIDNNDRNEAIAEAASGYVKEGRQVYIHVSQIRHGKILEGLIQGATFVHAGSKGRKDIIDDYRAGKIRCLISTLLREGVNIPGISCIIYAQGGKSEIALIQTVGRALRPDKHFRDAIIVDFLDTGNRILRGHTEERISAYRRVYGECCKV